jgi:hypothetical protein
MPAFVRRKWSLAALAFALVAVAAQFPAHRHATLGMVTMARATAGGTAEQQRPIAFWHARRSDHWSIASLASAMLTVGCWVAAARAGEAAPHGILTALLVAYLVLSLLVV